MMRHYSETLSANTKRAVDKLSPPGTLWTSILTLGRGIGRWNANRLAVMALEGLDEHTLQDLGLHRSSIEFAVQQNSGDEPGNAETTRTVGAQDAD